MGLLDRRVAIITGAGSGIGRQVTVLLAHQGAVVVAFDINRVDAEETIEIVKNAGTIGLAVQGDVTEPTDINRLVASTIDAYHHIDILVNNAGLQWGPTGLDVEEQDWHGVFDLNLTAQFLCARAVVPEMKARRYGRLIGIASDAGRFLSSGSTYAYIAAKGGVHGLHRALAEELGPWNITANVISPGNVMTERGRRFMEQPSMAEALKDCPLGRWTEPEEIANVVLFLASDLSSNVTGVTLSVNGGWHMVW